MGSNELRDTTVVSREMQSYIRRLLRPSKAIGSSGNLPNLRSAIGHGMGTGRQALTNGEKSSGGSKQLQAELISQASSRGSANLAAFSVGNNWLLSPVVGALNALLGLFGAGQSAKPHIRYHTQVRESFNIVESIAPERGTGPRTIGESASGLFGITQRAKSAASPSADTIFKNGTVPTSAMRAIGAISQHDTETHARHPARWGQWAGSRLPASIQLGAEGPVRPFKSATAIDVDSRTDVWNDGQSTEALLRSRASANDPIPEPRTLLPNLSHIAAESTALPSSHKEGIRAAAETLPAPHVLAWSSTTITRTSSSVQTPVKERQEFLSALRRSLSDSRGILDVLNEFQEGL